MSTPDALRPREAKQVIVIRRDLKMTRGKECAQAAHASMSWLSRMVADHLANDTSIDLTGAEEAWLLGAFVKVVVQVPDEETLLAVAHQAELAGVGYALIQDAGRTMFNGVPTLTALAVGPAWSDEVDAVTGDLKLY